MKQKIKQLKSIIEANIQDTIELKNIDDSNQFEIKYNNKTATFTETALDLILEGTREDYDAFVIVLVEAIRK